MTSDSEFERHLAISTWRLHHHYQAPYPSPSLQQLMFKMFFIERYPPSTPHGDGNGARATTTSTDNDINEQQRHQRGWGLETRQVCFHFFQGDDEGRGSRRMCVSRYVFFLVVFDNTNIFTV